jgi:DNA-binding IclR family transcriptional regulator
MSRLPTTRNALDAETEGASAHPIAIQVIERAMRLLDALAAQPDPVTLKELSATTGLHASTAHRILNDLVVGRYVERVDNGLYQLGMRLLELGSLVKGRLNVREAAISAMRSLHKLTGQTINLSVQQGDEIVYIDRAWSERSGMQVVRAIGGRAPLHLTSTGKLFLSTADARQVRAYALRTGLAGHTRNSLTDLDRLERELALVRRHGYARDNEELELGVRCIAAGIFDDTGKLVAGLSISAPAERLQDDWIKALVDTAASIWKRWATSPPFPPASTVWAWPQRLCARNPGPACKKRKAPDGAFLFACAARAHGLGYCCSTPAFLNSSPHCGTCCLTLASRACGFASDVSTVAPSCFMRSWNLGSARPACRLLTSLSTTGLGVPFGTHIPCQMPTSKPL